MSLVLQILFFLLVVSNLANGLDTQILDTRDESLAGRGPVRRLAAAHTRNLIQSRNTEHVLRHDHELHYLEGQSTEDALDRVIPNIGFCTYNHPRNHPSCFIHRTETSLQNLLKA